jgi:hypothetical protein
MECTGRRQTSYESSTTRPKSCGSPPVPVGTASLASATTALCPLNRGTEPRSTLRHEADRSAASTARCPPLSSFRPSTNLDQRSDQHGDVRQYNRPGQRIQILSGHSSSPPLHRAEPAIGLSHDRVEAPGEAPLPGNGLFELVARRLAHLRPGRLSRTLPAGHRGNPPGLPVFLHRRLEIPTPFFSR